MWRKTFASALVAILLVGVISLNFVYAGSNGNRDLEYKQSNVGIGEQRGRTGNQQSDLQRPGDQQQEALDEILAAENAITYAESLINLLQYDPPHNVIVLLGEAREHLTEALEAYTDEDYGEAYGLANAAERLARNAIRNLGEAPCPGELEDDNLEMDGENDNLETDNLEIDDENLTPCPDELEIDNIEMGDENLTLTEITTAIDDEETTMIKVWYLLAPNDRNPSCGDPWIHTYVLNTSGVTLYDVDFRQFVPSDLQLMSYYQARAEVRRYNEESVVGTESDTRSGSYTKPSIYSYTYEDGTTYTHVTTVSGDTRTETHTHTYANGQTYTYTISYPNPSTWSHSYTLTWSGGKETRTYGGHSYTNVNATGREGTSRVVETHTETYVQSGDEITVMWNGEYTHVNDYIQRSYITERYSQDGTHIFTSRLGPMDMIHSLIRVAPVDEIDPNKDYYVTTQIKFDDESGGYHAVVDNAVWREPFTQFMAIGAPYIGTATLDRAVFWRYRTMFEYPLIYRSTEWIDFIPPNEFDLSAPTSGTRTSNNTPELSWNPATDTGSGIDHYELYVDGLLNKVITGNTRTSESTSELAVGAHTWYVVAVDYAGNERRSTSTWTIYITPRIEIAPSDPYSGLSVSDISYSPQNPNVNDWVNITFTIQNAGNELALIFNVDFHVYDSVVGERSIGNRWFYNLDAGGSVSGYLTFRIYGNSTIELEINNVVMENNITVDNLAPQDEAIVEDNTIIDDAETSATAQDNVVVEDSTAIDNSESNTIVQGDTETIDDTSDSTIMENTAEQDSTTTDDITVSDSSTSENVIQDSTTTNNSETDDMPTENQLVETSTENQSIEAPIEETSPIENQSVKVSPAEENQPTENQSGETSPTEETPLVEDQPVEAPPTVVEILAIVEIKPETLNIANGEMFTAVITFTAGHNVADIDISTVACEGAPAVAGTITDGKLTIEFNRGDMIDVEPGDVELTVTGELTDGTPFVGSDVVKVIGNQVG